MSKKPGKPFNPYAAYDDYSAKFAEKVAGMIEKNKAPWQMPWDPNSGSALMPRNGVTGQTYRGSNVVNLMVTKEMAGYQSNEWLTFKQAKDMGGTVRKGEKAAAEIVFWSQIKGTVKPGEKVEGQDDDKNVSRSRLVPRFYHVFNRDQIDGLPPPKVIERPGEEWRHEKADELIEKSGAKISHDGMGRAYYRPAADSIHLPEKTAFKSMDGYYATALHELGHWTGHESRLNRDLSGPFGSESYAREELRVEVSSWLVGDRLGLGHDPSQHAAYAQHWAKIVRSDPKEIMKACADAEKICQYLGVEPYEQVLARKNEQEQTQTPVSEMPLPEMPPQAPQMPEQPKRMQGRGR